MNLHDVVEVYLDENEHPPQHVGTLRASFQGGRALASSSFEYSPKYLRGTGSYALSPVLPLVAGRQYAGENQPLFGAFSDVSPDDWGSALIDAAYAKERRPDQPSSIGAFDHLVQLNDHTRMGALRFRAAAGSAAQRGDADRDLPWLTTGQHTQVHVKDAARLAAAAARFEVYEATEEDMGLLGAAGSSLGGARPKATVRREDGSLWMLKLPSNRDRRADLEAWEAVALELAQRAGLDVPPFALVRTEGYKSSLLVKRFDRDGAARVGYISAMTAMGIGPQQHGRATYEDLADTVAELSPNGSPAAEGEDLRELFGRVALSVLVGNVDDHWKNHGFVRTARGESSGWRLSPVFDVNPSRPTGGLRGRSLSSRDGAGDRDIRLLMEGADAYALTRTDAAAVLERVVSSVEEWRTVAAKHHIASAEISHMAPAFSETQIEHAKAFLAKHRENSAAEIYKRHPELNPKNRQNRDDEPGAPQAPER